MLILTTTHLDISLDQILFFYFYFYFFLLLFNFIHFTWSLVLFVCVFQEVNLRVCEDRVKVN